MCLWIGLHFLGWIDYDGAAFSLELSEWDHKFLGFGGSENSGRYRLKNREERKFKKTDFSFSLFESFLLHCPGQSHNHEMYDV